MTDSPVITREMINRINELARKGREGELTPEELSEQVCLRRDYVEAIKAQVRAQLDHLTVVGPDGTSQKPVQKDHSHKH